MSFLSDVVKYEAAVEKILRLLKGLKGAKVGEEVTVPALRTAVGDQEWQFDAHPARRLK